MQKDKNDELITKLGVDLSETRLKRVLQDAQNKDNSIQSTVHQYRLHSSGIYSKYNEFLKEGYMSMSQKGEEVVRLKQANSEQKIEIDRKKFIL